MKYLYRISLVVSFFLCTVLLLLSFSGCCIFGGRKKEPEVSEVRRDSQSTKAETPQQKLTVEEPTAVRKEPVAVRQPVDKAFFQEGTSDVQEVVSFEDASGGIVEGKVNWSKGFITAVGRGISRPDDPPVQAKLAAREAAYTIALANLLETTKGVHVTSETTVEMQMVKSQQITRKVEGVIKGAIVCDEKYEEEGGRTIASVMVGIALGDIPPSMPLPKFEESRQFDSSKDKPGVSNASLASETLPKIDPEGKYISPAEISQSQSLDQIEAMVKAKVEASGQRDDEISKALLVEIRALRAILQGLIVTSRQVEPPKPYTGIVFNTVRTDMKRVLYPKIYVQYPGDDDYKLLYGDTNRHRPSEGVSTWSGWAHSADQAKNDRKVLDNPLIIDNVRVNGGDAAIIQPEDAERINELEEEHKFLAQGKVVFLL